jgi:hypothetical protein
MREYAGLSIVKKGDFSQQRYVTMILMRYKKQGTFRVEANDAR